MNQLILFMDGTSTAAQGSSAGMLIMIVAMFLIMYFFMIRPQSKKQKELAKFRKMLVKGQDVITAGGIYGTIKDIEDNCVVLEIAHDVKIKIDKNSIFSAPQGGTPTAPESKVG